MPGRRRASPGREVLVGATVTALAVAAMAVDHLMGDDPGLEDPPAFLISSGLSLALALVLFGLVVPHATRSAGAERPAAYGLACSLLAAVALPFTLWLGLPFVLGGAGGALGLVGRERGRSLRADAAAGLGALVVVLGTAAYAYLAVDKL